MLATLERVEILERAEQLSAMILESDVMVHYHACKSTLRDDTIAQKLIASFNKKKEMYEEVQRFGKYHPNFTQVTAEIRELKRELDSHPTIAAFKKAEQELQRLLDEISQLVGKAVSAHIKVPTGNPYFDAIASSGCGGGCGSGGACGCSA